MNLVPASELGLLAYIGLGGLGGLALALVISLVFDRGR